MAIPPPASPSDLRKLQFDYAWKWFSFHADQRTKMFNYMLLIFGIFAAGIVNSLDKHIPPVATAILCFIAGALALIFALLDRRNRDLVWLGEDVLMELERAAIFGERLLFKDRNEKTRYLGVLERQRVEEKGSRNWVRSVLRDAWRGKHRRWLPLIYCLIAFLFFWAGGLIWY